MKKEDIVLAWAKIREIDNTIPDEVLDFMKYSAMSALEKEDLYTKEQVRGAIIFALQIGRTEVSEEDTLKLLDMVKRLENTTNNLMFQRKPK